MENILRRLSVALAAAALSGLAAASCGGDHEESAPPNAPAASVTETRPEGPARPDSAPPKAVPKSRCKAGSQQPFGSGKVAYAAVVRGRVGTFRAPGRGALASFEQLNVNGVPTVFGVVGAVLGPNCRPSWYRVQLPLRPNGTVGYVRARDVRVERVSTRIQVDLSRRRVILYRDGREVLSATAAIGSPATPTPIGRYYVNQRLIPRDPGGPFGPGAIGISAFSPVLTGWAQGGPIAIHGTNRPELLGQRVSNGCIRVHNRDLRRLFAVALSGTPVTIHP
jgi:hypothetical protein